MTITVFGSAELDGGRRWYQSDKSGLGGQVLDRYRTSSQLVQRWVADSGDGFLHLVAGEPVPGRMCTVYQVDGSEVAEPYVIRHSLAVFRCGGSGAGVYWWTDGESSREWLTGGGGEKAGGWMTGWLDYPGPIPAEAVLAVDELAGVLHEFLNTKRRPDCVSWVERPVEVYGDGGAVIGWTLGGQAYDEKPGDRW